MCIYTITELMRLTRSELCRLMTDAEQVLIDKSSTEPERTQARTSIAAIHMALLRHRYDPAP